MRCNVRGPPPATYPAPQVRPGGGAGGGGGGRVGGGGGGEETLRSSLCLPEALPRGRVVKWKAGDAAGRFREGFPPDPGRAEGLREDAEGMGRVSHRPPWESRRPVIQ